MADYDVGSAALRIVPSFKGVVEAITAQAREWGDAGGKAYAQSFNARVRDETKNAPLGPSDPESSKQGDKSGGAFADSFKKRVTAALKSLPDAKINADSSDADRKVADIRAQLEELSGKTVGVDISDSEALAKLDAIKAEIDEVGSRSPSVQVQIDTGRASAELAVFQAEVDHLNGETATVHVNADTSDAESSISGIGSLIGAIAPAAIPLGGAALLGGAGAGVGLAAGLGGLAALALGLSGVTGAVKATTAARQAEAKASATGAASDISNAEQVKSAEQSLAEARRTAANQAISSAEAVKNAQHALTTAQSTAAAQEAQDARNVTVAVQAQNAAREQATRDLVSYQDAVVDSHLSAQQAALNLTSAQGALSSAQADPTTTAEQLAQAQLDVAQAQQAVVEANQQVVQSTQDNNKAQAAGVAGAPGVIAATRAVADAKRTEAAQRKASAQTIAKAEQGVTDALRAQANQQQESSYAITQAEESVASSMRSQSAASSALTAANSAQAAAYAKLTPAGRSFANLIVGTLEPALANIKKVAQRNLLPGLEDGIKAALPVLPLVRNLVGSLAGEVGHLADQAGHAFGSPVWTRFFAFVDRQASPSLDIFARIIGNLATGFAGLIEAADPSLNKLGRGLVSVTGQFASFGKNAGSSSGFQSFLRYVTSSLPVVGQTLEDVAGAIGHVVSALAPFGLDLLKGIDGLAQFVSAIPPALLEEIAEGVAAIAISTHGLAGVTSTLKDLVATASNPYGAIALGAAAAGVAVLGLYQHSQAFHDFVTQRLLPAAQSFGNFITQTLAPGFEHFADDILGGVKNAFGSISTAIGQNKGTLESLVSFMVNKILPIFGKDFEAQIVIMGKSIAVGIDLISSLWRAFAAGTNIGIDVLNGFITAIDTIGGPFGVHIDKLHHVSGTSSSGTASNKQALPSGTTARNTNGLAAGGTLGFSSIGPGFITNGPRAVVGEGNPRHPEYVIPSDPAYRPRAMALYRSLGAQLLSGGGVLGKISGAAGDVLGFARHLAGSVAGKALSVAEAPARALLGHMPGSFVRQILAGLINKVNEKVVALISGSSSGSTAGGDVSAHGASARAAQAIARSMLPQFGWDGAQMTPLLKLWNAESGWRYNAQNPSSPAYGIPQADPGDKMATAGADWRTNPATQILWGLRYIKAAYGDPAKAWLQEETNYRHFPSQGHAGPPYGYDQGGQIPPGITTIMNGTRQPEALLSGSQWANISALASGGNLNGPQLERIATLLEQIPDGVAAGVAGEFQSAAVAHARETQTQLRKSAVRR